MLFYSLTFITAIVIFISLYVIYGGYSLLAVIFVSGFPFLLVQFNIYSFVKPLDIRRKSRGETAITRAVPFKSISFLLLVFCWIEKTVQRCLQLPLRISVLKSQLVVVLWISGRLLTRMHQRVEALNAGGCEVTDVMSMQPAESAKM